MIYGLVYIYILFFKLWKLNFKQLIIIIIFLMQCNANAIYANKRVNREMPPIKRE